MSSRKKQARGEFVWVQEGDSEEYYARLVIPSNENSIEKNDDDDDDDDESEVEIQWTHNGRFQWVAKEDVRIDHEAMSNSRPRRTRRQPKELAIKQERQQKEKETPRSKTKSKEEATNDTPADQTTATIAMATTTPSKKRKGGDHSKLESSTPKEEDDDHDNDHDDLLESVERTTAKADDKFHEIKKEEKDEEEPPTKKQKMKSSPPSTPVVDYNHDEEDPVAVATESAKVQVSVGKGEEKKNGELLQTATPVITSSPLHPSTSSSSPASKKQKPIGLLDSIFSGQVSITTAAKDIVVSGKEKMVSGFKDFYRGFIGVPSPSRKKR